MTNPILRYKRFTRVCCAAVLGVLLPVSANALFGIGLPVFDSTAFGQLIEQYVRQGEQLAQEVQTVKNTLDHYKLALKQAEYYASKQYWLAVSNQLWRDQAANVLGETATWNSAINGSTQLAPSAWSNATTSLGDSSWMRGLPVGSSPNLSDLATVEIADTTGINTLRTLADFRNAQQNSAAALQRLESDALDGSDVSNVQVRQLNLTAAGTVQMLRSQQNVINVLGYQLEQQMIANKPVRDGIASNLNRYAAMYTYIQNEPTAMASPQATFAGYQIP